MIPLACRFDNWLVRCRHWRFIWKITRAVASFPKKILVGADAYAING
jgi:hypothetical protein